LISRGVEILAGNALDPVVKAEPQNSGALAGAASETLDTREPESLPSQSANGAALVDLSALSYAYEGERDPVLKDISLLVTPGEFVLILGPSGCGKSTLLQVMNGTIPHSLRGRLKGRAVVCGRDVANTKVTSFATEVGMVFQDPEAQIINIRVRDEVTFGLENLCRRADEILARQADALAFVGLGDAGDRSIFDMSGGQKQRVSIAAVLAARPRLLVLDEPTANLDPVGMAEVFAVLERLNKEFGTTILMVEHRVDELADKVSRVIMMDEGRVLFDGTPRAAFSRPREAHSEETEIVPTSAWFPQAAEFALDLSRARNRELSPESTPLNVSEAVTFAQRMIAEFAGKNSPALLVDVAAPVEKDEPGRPLVQIRDLSFGYVRERPILKNVSFDLASNAIVALLGHNGSGKTTLARTLIGINPPPKGSVLLGGKDISELGPREISSEVGYVFQNPDHQFVTDRIDDEVAYGLRVRDYSDEAIEQRVTEVLETVDLAHYRHRSPFSLSLGERRRLSVATMLVLEPRLLVLDEPTIGQDYERAQQLMKLMVRLRERYRTTVLMITHDVRLVAEWAERTLVLSGGSLVFDGAPKDLFGQHSLLRATGLLQPPIFELSATLSARHPDRVPAATLSVASLVASLVA
jgi:energy-coupling factor transporter ATP-binding protein EcfA2